MQLQNAKELLSIEYVSAIGVLLLFITYLIWTIKELKKEIKSKDDTIIDFIAKYYTISTKLYEAIARKNA